jgi:hypothetical protein
VPFVFLPSIDGWPYYHIRNTPTTPGIIVTI